MIFIHDLHHLLNPLKSLFLAPEQGKNPFRGKSALLQLAMGKHRLSRVFDFGKISPNFEV